MKKNVVCHWLATSKAKGQPNRDRDAAPESARGRSPKLALLGESSDLSGDRLQIFSQKTQISDCNSGK